MRDHRADLLDNLVATSPGLLAEAPGAVIHSADQVEAWVSDLVDGFGVDLTSPEALRAVVVGILIAHSNPGEGSVMGISAMVCQRIAHLERT
jgi:hypothetical protein